jgi:hypothetical protein
MNSSPNYSPRSWTENEGTSQGKGLAIGLLTLLLIVVVTVFLRWIWVPPAPQVFAFAVAVDETSENLLPRPAFAEWSIHPNTWTPFRPWLLSIVDRQPVSISDQPNEFVETVRTKNELDGLAERIDRRFREGQGSDRDTLLVYLRGIALVSELVSEGQQNPERALFLLAPEFNGQSEVPAGIRLDQFVQKLRQIPAANIVLLADFSDLTVLPELGAIDNDVPAMLARLTEGLQDGDAETNNRPVWIICPSASGQPNHVSHLLKKTLLQQSVEYALGNTLPESGRLNLADLYESILRYAHHVTQGAQTPLLFRSGSGRPIDAPESKRWLEAKEVLVAVPASAQSSNPSDEKEENTQSETASQAGNQSPRSSSRPTLASNDGRPIARGGLFTSAWVAPEIPQQDSTPAIAPGAISPTQGDAASSQARGEDPGASPQPAPRETDPWLRLWQIRDQIAARNSPQGWSAVDFAPDRWAEMQWQAVKLERLRQVTKFSSLPADNLDSEASSLADELERLQQSLARNTGTSETGKTLASAWARLKADLDRPNRAERGWLKPQLLAADLQPKWLADRKHLRDYMDAAGQAAAWLEFSLAFDLPEIESLRGQIYEYVNQLTAAKNTIAGLQTVLDQPFNSLAITKATEIRAQLQQKLASRIEEVEGVLDPSSKQSITWKDERLIQRLLASPLPTYEQRKLLNSYYLNSDSLAQRLSQPGSGNVSVDRSLAWPSLLAISGLQTEAAQEWRGKLQPLLAGNKEPDLWLKGCFKGFWKSHADSSMKTNPSGMMLPVSADRRLQIAEFSANTIYRHQLPETVTLTVRHRNGTSLNGPVWFAWNPESSFRGSPKDIKAASSLGVELPPGISQTIQLDSNDQTRLVWNLPPEFVQRLEGVAVELRFAMNEALDDNVVKSSLLLLPPNPDRVDLFVRKWDGSRSQLAPDSMTTVLEDGHRVLREMIRVPAIEHQATGQYQLYLCNRSSDDKWFRATLYSIQSAEQFGNGRVTAGAIQRTRSMPVNSLTALAQSGEFALKGASLETLTTKSGAIPGNAQPLILQSLAEGPQAIDSFGCVLVVQEVTKEEQTEPAPVGPAQYFWIDCVCGNPQPIDEEQARLITVRPQWQGEEVELEIELADSSWSKWEIENLRVEVNLTDDLGNPIKNRELNVLELSRQRPSSKLVVRPDFSDLADLPERIVMHLDIGGYPRAVAYQYRRRGGSIELATQGFLWLEPTRISVTASDGSPLATTITDSGSIVIPFRQEVSAESTGKRIEPDLLKLPVRIDFPRTLFRYHAQLGLDTLTPIRTSNDRFFESRISMVEERLAFSCSAQDHQYTLQGISEQPSLRGQRLFTASIEGNQIQSAIQSNCNLTFDREPPAIAEVRIQPTSSLYAGESLQLELPATDEDSGIAAVYFALNRPRGNERETFYDDADIKPFPAVFTNGVWRAELSAQEFEEFLGPVGQAHEVVARSVDLAGNVQDRNRSSRFYWSGVRQTPPPPQEKVEPPPTQEKPKDFTVTVTVVADGRPPIYAERIQVTGLESAQVSHDGKGKFTFSKVPQGTYEVKAVYSLPSGTTFEAKQPLQVNAAKNITLNARRNR